MRDEFNDSNETDSLYVEDDDAIGENMILKGLLEMPTPLIATEAPNGKPEVVLALTVVLVVLVIVLIISIFLLLYCVLKRQGGEERRKRVHYERRRRHEMQSQTKAIASDLARRAKVTQIAANIEAAVKSAQGTPKFQELSHKQVQTSSTSQPALPKPKPTSRQSPPSNVQPEAMVETQSLSINQVFVSRSNGPWQQVDHEPSDFSFELESESVDDICLQPL